MLASAPTPVALSELAEIERQDQVAHALAQLLSEGAGGLAALTAALRSPDAELRALTEELERLRCAVHLADLDACHSQHRLFSINFALRHDAALHEQEMDLLGASETERQAFFNGIHKRMKEGDFSTFGFTQLDFKEALEFERVDRARKINGIAERIQELQALFLPALKHRLAYSADVLAAFPWHTISATDAQRWRTSTDALTLEDSEDLWLVSQAWPTTPTPSVEAAAVTENASSISLCRDVLLVVDLSGSMCSILPVLKECLLDIVAHASDGDRLCLIGFNSEPSLLCDWVELDANLSSGGARATLCACVEAMRAKGGTRLVPALRFVSEQLRTRPPAKSAGPRSTAVVLLSDGDPEEPPEALSSAAAQTFATEEGEAPLVVALALGDESRPDLMALLAQCGCGASLYISGRDQLPSQLGRMWGILGGSRSHQDNQHILSSGRASCSPVSSDTFLILEPADGSHILETERSPGGTASLTSGDGRQLVVLRCGRHSPPGGEVACCRLAARLRLPTWAQSPIGSSDLQRPLLRSTWLWRDAHGSLMATSDVLRAVQVPALLIEARIGLPLRVVMAVDSQDCENFNRERFVAALSSALGIESGRLALGRLSPGSIITDLHLLGPAVEDMAALRSACAACLDNNGAPNQAIGSVLAQSGFSAATLTLPGGQALRRVLQCKLAAALEAAAACSPKAHSALDAVVAFATSPAVRMYDCDPNPGSGGAAAVAADASSAARALVAATAVDGTTGLSAQTVHTLEQQAHAHCQQLCPELDPSAEAVRCYETEPLRQASVALQLNADIRETAPPPAPPQMCAVDEINGGSVRIRSGDTGALAAAVTFFKFTIHYGDKFTETQIPVPAGKAASPEGVIVSLPAVESGAEHAIVAVASNGRSWGAQSVPLLCRLHSAPVSAGAVATAAASRRKRNNRRSSSLARSGHEVNVVEASATGLGTFSLAWEVLPRAVSDWRWAVHVEMVNAGPLDQEWSAEHLTECHASFVGLVPSATYRFCIVAEPLQPQVTAPIAAGSKTTSSDLGGLAVTGRRLGATSTAPAIPRTVEGIVAVPPFAKGTLVTLEADPALQPLLLPGTFTRIAGARSRNA